MKNDWFSPHDHVTFDRIKSCFKICFFLLSFIACSCVLSAVEETALIIPDLKGCKGLYWLTPSYEHETKYMLLKVDDGEIKNALIRIFSDSVPFSKINPLLLDGQPSDSGYLIFELEKSFWIIHVYPYVNNPKAANLAEICEMKPGYIKTRTFSMSDGLLVKQDYRAWLKKIPRPQAVFNFSLFEVEGLIGKKEK